MEKIKIENGIEYVLVGDYYLPNLAPQSSDEITTIGRYGRLHLKFIKEYKNGFYTALLMNGNLNSYLVEVDNSACEQVQHLMKKMAKQQGVIEELKLKDQIKWVGMMNNIKTCAEEVVFNQLIYV